MRAALALAGILLAATGAARAGDWADRAILGFSPDGGTFAFEEFGVQDGSGFPYANVYVIDTSRDAWVAGTPIRVMIEDEWASENDARAKAEAEAAPVLAAHDIRDAGYRIVASNPPTELSADPHAVRFLPDLYSNQPYANWDLRLTLLPMPDGEDCANLGPIAGFRLDLAHYTGESLVLYEDETIPASRFCPQDYAITDVIVFRPERPEPPVLVVLLNLIRQGFEGPDRRYLAVTAHPPQL